MSEVNASTLIGLQKTFRALFREGMETTKTMWPTFAMKMESTNSAEIYQWLGSLAALRQWTDSKTVDEMRGFDYTIPNLDWELTLGVDRNHIEDDQLGMYRPRINDLAVKAAQHPDKLLSDARSLGGSQLCYDGQFFHDNDHVIGESGTFSNLLSPGGGIATTALAIAQFRAARTAMLKFKNDKGEPFVDGALLLDRANPPFTVVCPPDLQGIFEEVLYATTISQTTNVLAGAAKLVVDVRLTDTNDWYLEYVAGSIKPYIYQERKAANLVSLDNPNATESVFMRKKFMYGVEGRWNVKYGFPQYSVKTTN
jgi:phage major head subunit gpT-like protein